MKGSKSMNPHTPLENQKRAITLRKFEKYQPMHEDHHPDPFGAAKR